jgi:hypothetical protein
MYPNPARDVVELTWPASPGTAELSIFDLSGREAMRIPVNLSEGRWRFAAPPRGTYVVKFGGFETKLGVE